jgi:hypothetical protein
MQKCAAQVLFGIFFLSFPAHAGRYSCSFTNVAQPCMIDSSKPQICQHTFSSNMIAACNSNSIDSTQDLIECAFYNPNSLIGETNETIKSVPDAIRAMTERAGFAAGAVTIGAFGYGSITVTYKEGTGTAVLQAACHNP